MAANAMKTPPVTAAAMATPSMSADSAQVWVASDDVETRSLLDFALRSVGYAVAPVVCAALLSTLVQHSPLLLIVDVDTQMAMSVCEQIRQFTAAPMLVLV